MLEAVQERAEHEAPDLASDQVDVLEKVLDLLSACMDVMSSNVWLSSLGAMDLSQMVVQTMWESDSPPEQIPHFEPDLGILPIVCRVLFANSEMQVIK